MWYHIWHSLSINLFVCIYISHPLMRKKSFCCYSWIPRIPWNRLFHCRFGFHFVVADKFIHHTFSEQMLSLFINRGISTQETHTITLTLNNIHVSTIIHIMTFVNNEILTITPWNTIVKHQTAHLWFYNQHCRKMFA